METSQKDSLQQHKVLVANRGEIAIRIMRACRKLGVAFTAIFTAEDAASGHVRYARENGGERSLFRVSSYHDANELMSVADQAGCTAVHPGYGFFAEDFRFARRVTKRDRKMIFIGPSWKIIRELGDKINTKRLARSLDVPTVPGSDRPIYDEMEAERIARSVFEFQVQQGIKRPLVLVKASAGGGGMGIEEVYDIDNFRSVYRRIRNYALRQFKDEGVLIEQRITDFNHLEVQIVSDRSGKNPVHFGTRNCSIQSTGLQKRVEVAPGFVPAQMDYSFDAAKVLQDIVHYSLTMARKVGYDNVGTWEWIVTRQGEPFLMEVNTRIQVEHGITEMITGVDLVRQQLRIASGLPLDLTQEDVTLTGHAIECRINAEDPTANFRPCPGKVEFLHFPGGPGVRVDSALYNGCTLSPYYDSLAAKVMVHAPTRLEAIRRMRRCLEEFTLEGFPTNAELSYELLFHPTFVRGGCTTAFLDRSLPELLEFSRRVDDHKG